MAGGDYMVTGPNTEGRTAPGYGPALSLAQTLAVRHGSPGTWYVRSEAGVEAHVSRLDDGAVETQAVAR